MIDEKTIYLLLIFIIPLLAWIVGRGKKFSKRLLYFLAVCMLLYNIGEYCYHLLIAKDGQFPVEFYAIACFLISLCVVFRLGFMRSFSGLFAYLSGFSYLIVNSVSPDVFDASPYFLWAERINCLLLYFMSFLLFRDGKIKRKAYAYFIGFAAVVLYAFVVKDHFSYADTGYVIFHVLTGSWLKGTAFDSAVGYVVYYGAILWAYYFVVKLYAVVVHRIMVGKEKVKKRK